MAIMYLYACTAYVLFRGIGISEYDDIVEVADFNTYFVSPFDSLVTICQ